VLFNHELQVTTYTVMKRNRI